MAIAQPKPGMFLDDEELSQLTGRRMKSRQILWLREEGIPFRVSATGHPVVTRSTIEGRPSAQETLQDSGKWIPRVLQGGR